MRLLFNHFRVSQLRAYLVPSLTLSSDAERYQGAGVTRAVRGGQ